MIKENRREVRDLKNITYEEIAEEVFTLNIKCPHCKKVLSLTLAKLELQEKP
jgi:hypothetical protein